MKSKYSSTTVFVFLLLNLAFVACGGGDKDADVQSKINSVTQSSPELAGVSATVSKGVVTLFGQAKSEKARQKAEKTIKDIDDVKDVVNNIMVVDEVSVTPDSELSDQTEKIVKKYKHAKATVNEGVITLRGEIDKDDLPQLIMDLNNLRPRRIENQLVVE